MKVTQEKLPASQIGLEIEINAQKSKNTYEKVLQNLVRSTNLPGFRKGKVPRQILLQRLGVQRIKAAALQEIIEESIKQAVEQESIESLGNYKLRSDFDELIQQYKPGEPLTISASLDVPPEVEPGNYQSLEIKAEEAVYDPNEVDAFIEERRLQKADLIPVEDRPAQMGDIAIVDFQGKLTGTEEEGQEIEGGQATNFQVELVEGKLVEGMVEGIVGMKPSETKEVAITFPEDYGMEDLAGKPAVFTITLSELKEKELPPLDDDFAQEVSDNEFETMAEYRESVETKFKEAAEEEQKHRIYDAIIARLLEESSVELPETMIEEEVNTILTQTAMQMQQYGADLKTLFTAETIPTMRANSRPKAIAKLQESLILAEIAKRESLQTEPDAVEAKIAEIKQQLSNQNLDPDRLRKVVEQDLLKEKTLDWLHEAATIELVPEGKGETSVADETTTDETTDSEPESTEA